MADAPAVDRTRPEVGGVVPEPAPGGVNRARDHLVAQIADHLGSSRETRWIVEHVEGCSAPSTAAPADVARRAWALAERRRSGEPLQYVLGRWAFRSLELRVDRRVLIPRPETEHVVERALAELAELRAAADAASEPDPWTPRPRTMVCVDLGTGSGAIALSLATEAAGAGTSVDVWATDVSADALEVARQNRDDLSRAHPDLTDSIHLALGSWFDALPRDMMGRVDLLVSNPPYVSESEYPQLEPDVRDWEPMGALVSARGTGGVGGTAAIETIVAGAPQWLRHHGSLMVEIAPHQADASIDVARRAGFSEVTVERDLAGRLRLLVARR